MSRSPLEDIKKVTDRLQEATQAGVTPGTQKVRVMQPALADLALSETPRAVASIISVIILTYFLLASGDAFLRKLVTVVPTLHDKKRAVEMTRQVETDNQVEASQKTGETGNGRAQRTRPPRFSGLYRRRA